MGKPGKGAATPKQTPQAKRKTEDVSDPPRPKAPRVGEEDFVRGGYGGPTEQDRENVKKVDMPRSLFSDKGDEGGSKLSKKDKRSGKSKLSSKVNPPKTPKDNTPKVGFLSFKKLDVGTVLMGEVTSVDDYEMTVSLPNSLVGTVPITEICDEMSELVAKEAAIGADDDSDDEEDEGDASDEDAEGGKGLPEMPSLYKEGDIIVCVVTHVEREKGKKKKVVLSVNPKKLNKGINRDNVMQGVVLPGYIESVEDHGCIVAFGIDGLTGFVKQSDLGMGKAPAKFQPVTALVRNVNADKRTVNVTTDPQHVNAAMARNVEGRPEFTYDTLSAGLLVNTIVKEVLPNGVAVTFLGFTGTIDPFHLGEVVEDFETLASLFPPKSKLKARILHLNRATKRVGLTLLPRLVSREAVDLGGVFGGIRVGEKYDSLPIVRQDDSMGLMFKLPISKVSDEHLDRLTGNKTYAVGKKHDVRVIGFNPIEGLVSLSMQKSVLEKPFLRLEDIRPGQIVEGTVMALGAYGLKMQITDHIRALVPTSHLADVELKNPKKKLKEGQAIRGRVLNVDAAQQRVLVTLKQTLVKSTLPILSDIVDAAPGMLTHGVVTSVRDAGCIVSFYNGVKGLLPGAELKRLGVTADMKFGKPIKVRVVAAYPETGKLRLSIQATDGNIEADAAGGSQVPIGTVADARVTGSTGEGLLVRLLPSSTAAFIHAYHLSDHPAHWARLLAMYSKEGTVLKDVLVLDGGAQPLLTLKQSIKATFADAPTSLAEVEEGRLMYGYVRKCADYGVFVGFAYGLSSLASLPHLSDSFVTSPAALFQIGQTVRAKVVTVDRSKRQFGVTLKLSECGLDVEDVTYFQTFMDEARLLHAFAFSKLEEGAKKVVDKAAHKGQALGGTVTFVKDFGVILDLGHDLTGFSTKDQSTGVECSTGSEVTARALDMDLDKRVLDVSLRPELCSQSPSKKLWSQFEAVSKEPVRVQVELVKENYLVLSLPDYPGILGVARTKEYNDNSKPFSRYKFGQKFNAKLVRLPTDVDKYELRRPEFALVNVKKEQEKGKKWADNSMNPKVQSITDVEEGMTIRAKVTKVASQQLNVDVGNGIRGRVHVTECNPLDDGSNPLQQFKVGDAITAQVIGVHDAKTHRYLAITQANRTRSVLELTLRVGGKCHKHIKTHEDVAVGQQCIGYIQEASKDHLWVHVGPAVRGRVSQLDASEDPEIAINIAQHFHEGQMVTCTVARVEASKGQLDLSLLPAGFSLAEGAHTCARIRKFTDNKQYLMVELPGRLHGRVHVTDLADKYQDLLRGYSEGSVVPCVVLSESGGRFDLSMRQSRLAPKDVEEDDVADREIEALSELSVGDILRGYVKSITESGCFVSIGRDCVARVTIARLSDAFISDWKGMFPPGTLVRGRVMGIDAPQKQVELSLRLSDINPDKYGKRLEFSDIKVGMKLKGTVRSVEKYGVFVKITNAVGRLSGLAHISECAEDATRKTDLSKLYTVGDDVKAMVLKVDAEKRQLSLGLKPSYFQDDSTSDESDEEDSADEMAVDVQSGESDAESEDAEGMDEDDDEEDEEQQGSESGSEGDSGSEAEGQEDQRTSKKRPAPGPLVVNAGFMWDVPIGHLARKDGSASESSGSEDELDSDDGEGEGKRRRNKRAKHRQQREEEERIARRERELLDADAQPQTAADFDRLLMGDPNNSFLWIQYMAMYLSQTEVDKARAVGEQALKTVSFRNENERQNVWKALMNLEARFGTPEQLLKTFERAQVVNDQKKVYMHLAELYDQLGRHQELFKLYDAMAKRFSQSKKIWIAFGLSKLRHGDVEGTRAVLKRSLKALPRRKHLMTISKFAQMEFKYGEAERGRTLFEEILSNYPKRVDLWSIYLDMEIKTGETENIRHLFERVVSLNLSSKKMKFFFKRYLDFEKNFGTEATVEHVKQRAREYVESKMQL